MNPFTDTLDLSHPSLLLVAILIWSIVWKGFALWRAAERRQKKWFIALLILNTAGILEIIYLFFVTRDKGDSEMSIEK